VHAVRDARGNVVGWRTQGGTVRQTITYDAWGKPTVSGLSSLTLAWKGLHWESGSAHGGGSQGLYYMRARWYDPELGRFLSEDPVGIQGGLNLYAFGGNDPINATDPTGQRALTFDERSRMSPICEYIDCGSIDVYDLGWKDISRNTYQDWVDHGGLVGNAMPHGTGLTLGHTIRIALERDDSRFDEVLAHELTHVWQNEGGSAVGGFVVGLGQAIRYQASRVGLARDPYNIDEVTGMYGSLFQAISSGNYHFNRFGSEQQGEIVAACIVLRQKPACAVPGYPFTGSAWRSR
jgi:RHS repeat-associated protein